ncbi:hypothetical protein [Saccharibacillus sacchari]|uniref:Uncharacterized protein n=1 Tax=Saccharibacillus sacchari TaxID=456493 RepID=A0ACC6P8Y7_9BACL
MLGRVRQSDPDTALRSTVPVGFESAGKQEATSLATTAGLVWLFFF